MGPKKRKVKEELYVNISMNENNEIELMELDEQKFADDTLKADSDNAEHHDEEVEPKLIKTGRDGHMMITMGNTSQVVCARCKRSFSSGQIYKKHVKSCDMKNEKLVDNIQLEKAAAKVAEPGKEFEKYYKKNPENPCYCCGEDIENAHLGVIKCKHCPKSFKTYANMERHIKTIHDENSKFPCPQCNAKCESKGILDEHLKTHQEGKPFSCIQCGKDFTRKYHLERHLNHAKCAGDKNPKNQFPCEVCKKIFSRIDNLREHLRGHMGQAVRKRDYQCPHCSKSFYGSSLLNIHIRTHTGEKPFPCDLCPKSFPSNGALRKHRRMHTGERPYECAECSATFAAKETLNRHKKTHTGDKPHKCNECGKRFIQATQLRSHMFHHTGESEYVCQICNRAFNRRIRLTEHMKYTHEGHKPLECSYCPKTFVRKEDLNRHEEIHYSTKEYICDVCQKSFASKPALKLHLRTHIKEEPVECAKCQKRFIRMDCLMRHIRTRHRDCLEELIQTAEEDKLTKEKTDEPETTVITINGEVYQIDNIGEIGNGKSTIVLEKVVSLAEEPMETEDTLILPLYEEEDEQVVENVYAKPATIVKLEEEKVEEPVKIEAPPPVKYEKKEKPHVERKKKAKVEKVADDSVPIFLSDKALRESVAELLEFLIDEDILKELGWPKAPVEVVLPSVIKRCGHNPTTHTEDDGGDASSRMRENAKILFALTMEGDNIKSLLNNHTIDEVIVTVLKSKQ